MEAYRTRTGDAFTLEFHEKLKRITEEEQKDSTLSTRKSTRAR